MIDRVKWLLLLFLMPPVLANSTLMHNVEPAGLDYYWVPGNVLLFHIPYPWDFALYGFAVIGFCWVVWRAWGLFERFFP